jgi:hypothetical protein
VNAASRPRDARTAGSCSKSGDLSGKGSRIGTVDHLSIDAVSHHFAHAFGVGRDHRATTRHGFDQGLRRCKRR